MDRSPIGFCRPALSAFAVIISASPLLAQGDVETVVTKSSMLGNCYVEKTQALSDDRPCKSAATVVDSAIKACSKEENELLAARKAAEMDADKSIIVGLRDRSRKALLDTVFTARLSAAHCKNE